MIFKNPIIWIIHKITFSFIATRILSCLTTYENRGYPEKKILNPIPLFFQNNHIVEIHFSPSEQVKLNLDELTIVNAPTVYPDSR